MQQVKRCLHSMNHLYKKDDQEETEIQEGETAFLEGHQYNFSNQSAQRYME